MGKVVELMSAYAQYVDNYNYANAKVKELENDMNSSMYIFWRSARRNYEKQLNAFRKACEIMGFVFATKTELDGTLTSFICEGDAE